MTMRRLLPLAAVLAAAALAGCGGSDEPSASDAQAAYRSVRTQIVDLGGSIAQAINGAGRQTDVQLADAFDALAERGRAAVGRLEGLEVPDDLVAKRDALEQAIDRGTDDLADIARAARASDAAAAREAAAQLIRDSETIRTARAAFERALRSATSQ